MRRLSAFSWTPVVWVAAACVAWVYRSDLLDVWLAPALGATATSTGELRLLAPAELLVANLRVTLATAGLATFPVFAAEAWLLLCRRTGRPDARGLALPFAVASAGAMLLAFWLARPKVVAFFLA